jgi:hypothetical protein
LELSEGGFRETGRKRMHIVGLFKNGLEMVMLRMGIEDGFDGLPGSGR